MNNDQTIVDETALPEPSIRQWYQNKTRRAIRSLVVGTLILFVTGVTCFVWAPEWILLKLELFNGAITIPAAGGVWLLSFTLVWLLPMREVSFRSFEAMEATRVQIGRDLAEIKKDARAEIQKAKEDAMARLEEKMKPWFELGERLNREFTSRDIENIKRAARTAGELSEPAGPPPAPVRAGSLVPGNGVPEKEPA